MVRAEAFVLVAHRGDSAYAPENTIAAFDAAVDSGFPHFETDCQLTSDGVVVILHDEQLGRTTPQGQGAVAAAAAADLLQLDAGSWFDSGFGGSRIPLLSELLRRYHGRAHVHLELKSQQPELAGRVMQELAAGGWWVGPAAPQRPELQQRAGQVAGDAPGTQPRATAEPGEPTDIPPPPPLRSSHPHFAVPGLTITSFHLDQLKRSLQVLPAVTHGWLIHELTDERIQEALTAGLKQLCPRANALTPEAAKRALEAGMSLRAWGIRDMQLLHHVVSCGCHGATVNWPREAREVLAAESSPLEVAAEAAAGRGPGSTDSGSRARSEAATGAV